MNICMHIPVNCYMKERQEKKKKIICLLKLIKKKKFFKWKEKKNSGEKVFPFKNKKREEKKT